MNDSILKILYSDGVYPDNHDVVYESINGDIIVLANAEVETVENSLNVDIKSAVKLNEKITR
ncbi:hypothetical protein [Mesoplasma melaleucae]|uniref:Uncharacterized protein n=1 Tax=Mesoplasma melaleucae TaxID=81459 RepID=A0A2K8NW26_9MOLU|nr:hypothetical protein [Mesoplasma melaleucae]ATZ18045.1 hypothetical protein EMELA_v1c05050 [Mesoplasma melaleucae]